MHFFSSVMGNVLGFFAGNLKFLKESRYANFKMFSAQGGIMP